MAALPTTSMQTPRIMTNEESYADRRQLFKNIWEAAMTIDGKEDIMTKPKVIKTLRLDELDKCIVGKTKKQRIRNLRHVCKRILDFCDKQDAKETFYEKIAVEGPDTNHTELKSNKKTKTHTIKKKVVKAKSMFGPSTRPKQPATMAATVSDQKDELPRKVNTKPARKVKRTTFVKSSAKSKKSPMTIDTVAAVASSSTATNETPVPAPRRRVGRKRKKLSKSDGLTTGYVMKTKYEKSRHAGRL